MQKFCLFIIPLLALLAACAPSGSSQYPWRWVYASTGLQDDGQVDALKNIVQTASEHGLNGLLLSCGADRISQQPPEYVARLKDLKAFAAEHGVEVIPSIFSIGYGGSIMAYNKNLAEGLPVQDALYVVKSSQAVFTPEKPQHLVNGGFEDHDGARAQSFQYSDESGQRVSIDKTVVKEGKAALRFDIARDDSARPPVLSQVLSVTPHRQYRISAWIKTAGIDPAQPFRSGNVRIMAHAAVDNRQLHWININAPANGDWFRADLGFNSLEYDAVKLTLGPMGRTAGTFWIDGVSVSEVGLLNVLRRPGTPVAVKNEKSGQVYAEGQDYETIADPELDCMWDHDGPAIGILRGSRIKNGERLCVSYYHGTYVHDHQVSVCMSEPEVYDIYHKNAQLMAEQIGFKKFFLSLDEIRMGGTCAACKARNFTMAEITGDCFTKINDMLKATVPDAEIFIWSDMIDPNHNADSTRTYYYHVPETFYGSWNYIPKDMVIACWYHDRRDKSLAHFSGLGYRTIAGAYYDADNLENPKNWLNSLANTPNAGGIIYTSWQRKYALLADFGDLVMQTGKGPVKN